MRSLLFLSCFFVLLSSCAKKEAPQTTSPPLRKVKLALNWFPDSQHGGFYAAKLNGFYAAEGLDVEIIPGGPGTPVMQQLVLGRADFAVVNADVVLEANSKQANVVAVMAAMQNSPRCIMVRKSSGITSFEQLNDQKLTLLLGSGKAYCEFLKQKVDLEDISMNQYDGRVTSFVANDNVAQQAYVFSEPHVARNGVEPHCLMVSELGFNPYSSCVVTNGKTIDSDPDLVKRFVAATTKGWTKYLEHPVAANQEILGANARMDMESLEYGAQEIKKLCLPTENSTIGSMTAQRWETLNKQLIEINKIPKESNASNSFSLEFIEQVYASTNQVILADQRWPKGLTQFKPMKPMISHV